MTVAIARAVKAAVAKPAREVTPHGMAFIEHAEGEPGTGKAVLVAYQDGAGVWTIGWGHTRDVVAGMTCTQAQAEAWLDADLDDAEHAVCTFVTVPLNDNEFDALVSFAFNVGTEAFMTSLLLRKLNAGDRAAVPAEMARWNKITVKGVKQVSAGLTNRRAAEASLFVLPVAVLPPVPVDPSPVLVTGPDVQTVAPPTELPAPRVAVAAIMANEVPTAPPTKVMQAPGGKTGVTALIAGAGGLLTEGYSQVAPTIDAVRRIIDGIGHGPSFLRVIGAVLVLVSIGSLAYSLYRHRRELRGE